ncbi:MAG: phage head closure protein [Castellaniella sp.]
MRAGPLNSRVAIQRLTQVQDETGQVIEDWVAVADVWADIRHLSGLETVRQGVSASEVRASVRIRWRDDVTSAMRLVANGKTYEIEAVLPSARTKEFIDLTCKVIE